VTNGRSRSEASIPGVRYQKTRHRRSQPTTPIMRVWWPVLRVHRIKCDSSLFHGESCLGCSARNRCVASQSGLIVQVMRRSCAAGGARSLRAFSMAPARSPTVWGQVETSG